MSQPRALWGPGGPSAGLGPSLTPCGFSAPAPRPPAAVGFCYSSPSREARRERPLTRRCPVCGGHRAQALWPAEPGVWWTRLRWPPQKQSPDAGCRGPVPGGSLAGAAWAAKAGARVTLDLDPGLGVTQGPDVHHHVHAARGKVLVVRGPGQADDLRVVSVEDVVLLPRVDREAVRPSQGRASSPPPPRPTVTRARPPQPRRENTRCPLLGGAAPHRAAATAPPPRVPAGRPRPSRSSPAKGQTEVPEERNTKHMVPRRRPSARGRGGRGGRAEPSALHVATAQGAPQP